MIDGVVKLPTNYLLMIVAIHSFDIIKVLCENLLNYFQLPFLELYSLNGSAHFCGKAGGSKTALEEAKL